jgi:hypothetical protein
VIFFLQQIKEKVCPETTEYGSRLSKTAVILEGKDISVKNADPVHANHAERAPGHGKNHWLSRCTPWGFH